MLSRKPPVLPMRNLPAARAPSLHCVEKKVTVAGAAPVKQPPATQRPVYDGKHINAKITPPTHARTHARK
jgi:hypothetical protein